VMNPPWDAVKPDDDDFFSQYKPEFRKISNKQEKNIIKKQLLHEKSIQDAFDAYNRSIQDKIQFYKFSDQYVKRGAGDTDMWKLFLERALSLITSTGSLSIIIPSGIISNEGAKELRTTLLDKRIRYLYEFENAKGIFPDVHRSYKFVLLVMDNMNADKDFPAMFYLHSVDVLDGKEDESRFVNLNRDFIKLVSPSSFSIPEVRSELEVGIFEHLYRLHPLISEGIDNGKWTFKFVTEMHRTNASHLFKTEGKGWPLIEGKHFRQFIPDYEKINFTVNEKDGLDYVSKIREYGGLSKEIHEVPRLCFRDVARSTDVRAMISCIVPKKSFTSNTAPIVIPRYKNKLVLGDSYYRTILYLAGIFNSMTFDFLIRRRITMHLNFFYIEQTPIPSTIDNEVGNAIVKIAAQLSYSDERYNDLAKSIGIRSIVSTIKERVDMTARLDALVAHHFGLNRRQYETVIKTFDAFQEDEALTAQNNIQWSDLIVRKFNGEVRRRVLKYYDEIIPTETSIR
jgi:Eco57I restriction-modification methylase